MWNRVSWGLLLLLAHPVSGQQTDLMTLVDFRSGLPDGWAIVNDGVMGGVSSSTLRWDDGVAVFAGRLSLDNNGGFASVRIPVNRGALSGATGLRVRVRGDGRRYQLRLRRGRGTREVAWAAGFVAPAEWTTVTLAMDAFEPTFRGYRPARVGSVDPATVGLVGFMLADKEEGAFRMEVEWIGLDRDEPEA